MGTTVTQSDGRFEYVWTTETAGLYAIRAAWSGDELYTGAISSTKSATVIPLFLGCVDRCRCASGGYRRSRSFNGKAWAAAIARTA